MHNFSTTYCHTGACAAYEFFHRALPTTLAKAALEALVQSQSTSPGKRKNSTVCCAFCGKSQHEVKKLVMGPPPAAICDGCLAAAYEGMYGEPPPPLPK